MCHYAKVLSFRIKDQDELGTEMVGEVNIPVEDLLKKPNLSIIGMYFFEIEKKNFRISFALMIAIG